MSTPALSMVHSPGNAGTQSSFLDECWGFAFPESSGGIGNAGTQSTSASALRSRVPEASRTPREHKPAAYRDKSASCPPVPAGEPPSLAMAPTHCWDCPDYPPPLPTHTSEPPSSKTRMDRTGQPERGNQEKEVLTLPKRLCRGRGDIPISGALCGFRSGLNRAKEVLAAPPAIRKNGGWRYGLYLQDDTASSRSDFLMRAVCTSPGGA